MKQNKYQLPYEAALWTIELQMATLDELRQRTNYLLAAGVGAGGITAGIIFTFGETERIGCLGLVGVTLAASGIIGVYAATAYIWRAVKKWTMTLDAKKMVKHIDRHNDIAKLQRREIKKMHKGIETNRTSLGHRMRAFNIGLWAMLAEIVGFAFLIGDIAGS